MPTSTSGDRPELLTAQEMPMLKIVFLNMPFGVLNLPAFGCIRLQAALKEAFGEKVQVDLHYPNMDYALRLGDLALYDHFVSSYGFMSQAGDWLFRQEAFPDSPDNSPEYFARYYETPETLRIRTFLQKERDGLEKVLDWLIERYRLLDADIVGFPLLYCQTVASFALARRLKQRKPAITTLIGGPGCEGEMGQGFAEHIPQIDYVFSGPALVSMPEFIKRRLAGDLEGCESINGVLSKFNRSRWGSDRLSPEAVPDGAIAVSGEDLDINANCIPDYLPFLDLVESRFPKGEVKPVLLFETSRGCRLAKRNPCKFCGLNGKRNSYDIMAPEKALAQIQALHAYTPRACYFVAIDNQLPHSFVTEVFPLLPRRDDILIRYEVCPDFSAEEIGVLSRASVRRCQPGLESLSNDSLRLMRKGTTSFRNLQFLKACTRHPFWPEWNLLINIPGEQEAVYEKYLRDVPQLTHLPPPAGFFPIMYVRFSPYFQQQAEHGLDLQPQDFYRLIYPFDDQALGQIAYFFIDRNTDGQQVDEWLDRLNSTATYWRQRWFNQDEKNQAQLCFYEESTVVYDTRSGQLVEHELTPFAKRVLEFLEKPASRKELSTHFRDTGNPDKEVDFLLARGLLFEDEGRFLSLVAG